VAQPSLSLDVMVLRERDTFAMIPLELAVYCENCRHITNSPGDTCIRCDSSGGLMNLANVLDRKQEVVDVTAI
jgi:hypothetical protein